MMYIIRTLPQAACGAVRCYLALHDKPLSEESDADEAARVAAMSVEDRKKYKLKKKKVRQTLHVVAGGWPSLGHLSAGP